MNRSEIMARVKSKNTRPELLVERVLKAAGVPFKKHPKDIHGHPDFVVGNTLIFVDGCFWHKCVDHCKIPKTNSEFWSRKLRANMRRDRCVNRILKKAGYSVKRIWEHDLKFGRLKCRAK